jgi:hypothetical protein
MERGRLSGYLSSLNNGPWRASHTQRGTFGVQRPLEFAKLPNFSGIPLSLYLLACSTRRLPLVSWSKLKERWRRAFFFINKKSLLKVYRAMPYARPYLRYGTCKAMRIKLSQWRVFVGSSVSVCVAIRVVSCVVDVEVLASQMSGRRRRKKSVREKKERPITIHTGLSH